MHEFGSQAKGRSEPFKRRLLGNGNIDVSFEFFPPKTESMNEMLWRSIRRLEPFGPTNVSVTYGAGGSTRGRTHETVARILRETSLRPAAHLTCIDATRSEVDVIIRDYWELGVRHLVALRGDAANGAGFRPTARGYVNAAELVGGIRSIAPFDITVAAHPERHSESLTALADMDTLKAKIDAGASSAITQFFFDNQMYFRYLDHVRAKGISIPIVPGIVPIHNYGLIAKFASRVGVGIPAYITRRFSGLEDDPLTHRLAAAATCAEQVLDLVAQGVTNFHFYTLNRADLVYSICHMLGLRPKTELAVD